MKWNEKTDQSKILSIEIHSSGGVFFRNIYFCFIFLALFIFLSLSFGGIFEKRLFCFDWISFHSLISKRTLNTHWAREKKRKRIFKVFAVSRVSNANKEATQSIEIEMEKSQFSDEFVRVYALCVVCWYRCWRCEYSESAKTDKIITGYENFVSFLFSPLRH